MASDKRKEITEALKSHYLQVNKSQVISYIHQNNGSFADTLKAQKETVSEYYTGKLIECVH